MTAHVEEHLDLCAGHALRNLHEGERRKLMDHVASGCPECEMALSRFGAAALVVARGAPLVPPPASLRAKVISDAVLASAAAVERAQRVPGAGLSIGGWIAIYLAVAVAGVAIYYNLEVKRLKSEQTAMQHQMARLSAEMVEAARWELAVAGPTARMLSLDPVHPGSGAARATAFYDPTAHRALIAGSGLPLLSGARLVAWAVEGTKPVALGVLIPDRSGRAVLRAERPSSAGPIRGFAISREPAGAMPPRPSDVLLQGSTGGS